MHRRILAPVAAAALAFGLVACGDTGGGTVTTPPPSINIDGGSDDGSAEPSDGGSGASDGGGESPAAAPVIPAPDPADYPGMDQNTPEGAEQAFRYYIAVVYWAHATGDTEATSSLYSETCGSCSELANDINKLRTEGELWGAASITDVGIDSHESENFDTEISYGFTLGPHERPGDAVTHDASAETKMTAIAGLDWNGSAWKVGGMQIDVSQHN